MYGGTKRQQDSAWKHNLLFSEHFHGDNGPMHQTGRTALAANLVLDPAGPEGEAP